MGKNGFLEKQRERDKTMLRIATETERQYMFDTHVIAANEVLGLGYKRILTLEQAWSKIYDQYAEALSNTAEADYYRAKLDDRLRLIYGNKMDFLPFEDRYDWIKGSKY